MFLKTPKQYARSLVDAYGVSAFDAAHTEDVAALSALAITAARSAPTVPASFYVLVIQALPAAVRSARKAVRRRTCPPAEDLTPGNT